MSASEEEKTSSEEESSTSEEEDEDGKEWTDDTEKTFLKTLSSLKSKDPKIYDTSVKFFNEKTAEPIDNEGSSSSSSKKKIPKEKSMYLRDYERKILLEKGGILTDEETDEEAIDEEERKRASSPTYVEEQKALKNSFKKFIDDEKCDPDDDRIAGFLKVKVKSANEKAQEEADYVEWLKGQKSELNDKEVEDELKYLRDYWTDPNLNEGEQFLRDYVLNKKYLEEDEENRFDAELSFSEEEEILQECDEYEQKYNFRFEEPDQDFIKTFPRVIEDSLRRKDEKRKRKREERKKRKEEQLVQKQLEVKRLKKQKKEELMEKIKKLKELTGNKTLGFNDEELEGDFNPEEFDSKMNQIYNDEFYNEEDCDPNLNLDPESDHDEDFIMDCDYDPEATRESKFKKQTRSSQRKGHKKTTFAEAVEREKPIFDPADKTYQEYLDEYYGLDFEDVIDDLPCRYKYREVMPNDFGLTVEEILAADDKELNNWCSMKKVVTMRPEQNEKFDKKIYSRRAQDLELKKKYLPSLFKNENNTEVEETIQKKKKKKRRKRKMSETTESASGSSKLELPKTKKMKIDENVANERVTSLPKTKKLKSDKNLVNDYVTSKPRTKKRKFDKDITNDSTTLSDERLKAYGFNPKKYKNKVKYGQS